ncbi:MAG: hypothetical protein ACQ9ET_06090 [Nitrosomonadaceae bacterium]
MPDPLIHKAGGVILVAMLYLLWRLYDYGYTPLTEDELRVVVCSNWLQVSEHKIFVLSSIESGNVQAIEADFCLYIRSSKVPVYVRDYTRKMVSTIEN